MEGRKGVVEIEETSLGIGDEDRIGHRTQGGLQGGVEAAQVLLGRLARGDIDRHRERADDLTRGIPQGHRGDLGDPAPTAGQRNLQLQRRDRLPFRERALHRQLVRGELPPRVEISDGAPGCGRIGGGGGDLADGWQLVLAAQGGIGLDAPRVQPVREAHAHG